MELVFWLVLLGISILLSLGYYAGLAPSFVGLVGALMLIILSINLVSGVQYATGENTTITADNTTSTRTVYSDFKSPLFAIILFLIGIMLMVDIATNITGVGGY